MIIVVSLIVVGLNIIGIVYGLHNDFFIGYKNKVYLPTLKQWGIQVNIFLWLVHFFVQIFGVYLCVSKLKNVSEAGALVTLMVLLYYIAIFDMQRKVIPNKLVVGILGLRLMWWIVGIVESEEVQKREIVIQLIYTFVLFLILMLVLMVAKGGFGFGDVKLLLVMSFYVDYSLLMSVVMVALIGALAVSLYILAVKNGNRKDTIPFAPFIYFGYILNMVLLIN